MDWLALVQALAPFIGPVLMAILKQLTDQIPKAAQPVVAAALGATIAHLAGATMTTSVELGASGVFVREVVDQTRKAWRARQEGVAP